jgi:hypothetical protein
MNPSESSNRKTATSEQDVQSQETTAITLSQEEVSHSGNVAQVSTFSVLKSDKSKSSKSWAHFMQYEKIEA